MHRIPPALCLCAPPGTCPPFPSKSYNATALVPANQLSSFVNPPVLAVCARGWDGKSVYNLTQ